MNVPNLSDMSAPLHLLADLSELGFPADRLFNVEGDVS
jgi:hypothetical protein